MSVLMSLFSETEPPFRPICRNWLIGNWVCLIPDRQKRSIQNSYNCNLGLKKLKSSVPW